ncbi:MAG TPA: ribonuclease H-like domain-containing protein [Acidimicrobiia bacterium]
MPEPLRTLIVDVETSPFLTWSWHQKSHPQHFMVTKPPILLTWAAKWRGERKVYDDRLTVKEVLEWNDSAIAESLAELLREADAVVAHNAIKFDLPKVNGRLAHWDLPPLAPIQVIDTLKLAQRELGYPYSNLDYLARQWGFGGKLKVHWEIWEEVLHGPDRDKALRQMVRYNRRDVQVLDPIFEKVIRYSSNVPRLWKASFDGELFCDTCGSTRIEKRGVRRTQAGAYQRYHCLNEKCGKYGRFRTSNAEPKAAGVPL